MTHIHYVAWTRILNVLRTLQFVVLSDGSLINYQPFLYVIVLPFIKDARNSQYNYWMNGTTKIQNVITNDAQCDYKGHTIWLQTTHKVTQNTDINKTFLTFKMLYDFTVQSLKQIHLQPQENYGLPWTDFHEHHKWWKQFIVLAGADPSYCS